MKQMNHPAFLLCPLFALAFFLSCFCAAEAKRPNILLIFSDDHAKKALSCYGNQDIETPALDRIANEGMRFEHALTPNSFAPRHGLLPLPENIPTAMG